MRKPVLLFAACALSVFSACSVQVTAKSDTTTTTAAPTTSTATSGVAPTEPPTTLAPTSTTPPALNEPRHVRVPGEYEITITSCGEDDTGLTDDPYRAYTWFRTKGTITNLSDLRRDFTFYVNLTDVATGYVFTDLADAPWIFVDIGETLTWNSSKNIRYSGQFTCSIGEMFDNSPVRDALQP